MAVFREVTNRCSTTDSSHRDEFPFSHGQRITIVHFGPKNKKGLTGLVTETKTWPVQASDQLDRRRGGSDVDLVIDKYAASNVLRALLYKTLSSIQTLASFHNQLPS